MKVPVSLRASVGKLHGMFEKKLQSAMHIASATFTFVERETNAVRSVKASRLGPLAR